MRILAASLLCASLLVSGRALAEDAAPAPAPSTEGAKPEVKAPQQKTPDQKTKRVSLGLLLCRIVWVDEKRQALFVHPLEGDGPRRTYYLDKQTIIRKDKKPAPKELLAPGRKVAIRYVDDGDIAYAEGVFFIGEEIVVRDYEMPKKKPPPGAAKEGGGGEHGAAPKPAEHAAPAKHE